MSLNSYVLNGGVLNGTRSTKIFAQAVTATSSTSTSTLVRGVGAVRSAVSTSLSSRVAAARRTISYLSTSIATVIKAVTHAVSTVTSTSTSTLSPLRRLLRTLTIVSTSNFTFIKGMLLTKIVLGNKYLITGGVGATAVDTLAINADLPVYTTTTGVGSTVTVYPGSVFKRALSVAQTNVSTLARSGLKVFTTALTSTNTLVRQIQTTWAIASTSVSTLARRVGAIRSVVSTSVVTSLKAMVKSFALVTSNMTQTLFKTTVKPFALLTSLSTFSLVKRVLLTKIVSGNRYLITGGVGSVVGNLLAINNDAPVYNTTTGATSVATVSTASAFIRTITAVQTSTSTLVTAFKRGLLLLISSTSVVSILRATSHSFLVVLSISTASSIKKFITTLVSWGSKYVITGGVGSSTLGSLAINSDNPVYTTAPYISSTSTVSTPTIFKRVITLVQISVAAVGTMFNKGVILTAVNTSIAVLRKMVQPSFWLTGTTGTSTTVKQTQLTRTVSGSKYVITGGIGSSVLDSLSLNSDSPVYTVTPAISSSATVTPITVYKFLLTLVNTSVAAFGLAVARVKSLSILSTSISAFLKLIQPSARSISSTSSGAMVKGVGITRTVSGVSYVISGGIGSTMLNSLAVNTDSPVYTTLPNVQSTATISPKSVFFRLIAFVNVTVAAVGTAITRVVSLSFVSTTASSLIRQAQKTFNTALTSIAAYLNRVGKSVSNLVTSNTVLTKLVSKLLSFGSTCLAFLTATRSGGTVYFAVLTVTSYTTAALAYVINRYVVNIAATARDTIIVPAYGVLVSITNGISSILVRPSKTVITSTEEDNLDG